MGDQEFAEYVQANYDNWLRFLQGLAGQHAEDVLQSTLVNLWAFREKIDPTTVDALAFTALRRAAIDHWREEQRQQRAAGAGAEADTHTPAAAAQEQEMARGLRSRLAAARATLTRRE